MINSSIFKRIFLGFIVIASTSCDSDFNELGSNIIEDDIHHDNITRIESEVVAFDRATGDVQSNNLPLNSLGVYINPAFGKTTAHFVSQVKLAVLNPTFTSNVVVDSVYLYVPYFTKSVTNNGNGTATYVLDSIHGNPDVAMRLNIYENKFFLRDSDAGESFLTGQKYFSNDKPQIDAARNPVRLNDSPVAAENDQFKISAAQIERRVPVTPGSTTMMVAERFAPGIFIHLNKDFFAAKIINSPSKLINHNVFKEWFRGIYFNIEDTNGGGAMATMDFSKGKIVIIYKQDKLNIDGTPVFEADGVTRKKERKTLELNMTGSSSVPINTVNLFENEYSAPFSAGITSSDETNGDERLFLRGGSGSVAFINLDMADLEALREENMGQKVLINEANLTFYVDQSESSSGGMAGVAKDDEPVRIYLYDLDNKRPIYDFYTDVSTNTFIPKFNKRVHGGIIKRQSGKGYIYKIRLTDHINNIINKDSTNVRLGLAVTESINFIGNAALKTPVDAGTVDATFLPAASVISPVGTVLFGNNIPFGTENYDKRLKLEIFYTKPN